jgi:hypothetical protein
MTRPIMTIIDQNTRGRSPPIRRSFARLTVPGFIRGFEPCHGSLQLPRSKAGYNSGSGTISGKFSFMLFDEKYPTRDVLVFRLSHHGLMEEGTVSLVFHHKMCWRLLKSLPKSKIHRSVGGKAVESDALVHANKRFVLLSFSPTIPSMSPYAVNCF